MKPKKPAAARRRTKPKAKPGRAVVKETPGRKVARQDWAARTWAVLELDQADPEHVAAARELLAAGVAWIDRAARRRPAVAGRVAAVASSWPVLIFPTGKTSPAPSTLGTKAAPRQTGGRKVPDLAATPANRILTAQQIAAERLAGAREIAAAQLEQARAALATCPPEVRAILARAVETLAASLESLNVPPDLREASPAEIAAGALALLDEGMKGKAEDHPDLATMGRARALRKRGEARRWAVRDGIRVELAKAAARLKPSPRTRAE